MARKVILLVEPVENDCRAAKAMMEGWGYEVVAMGEVEAAIEVLPYAEPDLVVTAHPLPTPAEGRDFATHVKTRAPRTLVIGMVRRGLREVARDALTNGCDDILTKPVDPQILSAKVRHLIGGPDDDVRALEH
jgi:CheY-like chemotaxis protein